MEEEITFTVDEISKVLDNQVKEFENDEYLNRYELLEKFVEDLKFKFKFSLK